MRTLLELPLDVIGLVLKEVPSPPPPNLFHPVDSMLTSIQIRTKRDLWTLCLVCSTLRTLATPNLYRSVNLPVEDGVISPKHLKCFLAIQNDGVRFIKNLRVFGDWNDLEKASLFNNKRWMHLINVMVLLLLQRTTRNQLQSFEWLVPCAVLSDVTHQLQAHHSSLRKVSWRYETINGLPPNAEPMRLPQLAHLSVRNIATADQLEYVQRWITSCTSLRKLEITTSWEKLVLHTNNIFKPGEFDSPVTYLFQGIIEKSAPKTHRSMVDVICGSAELVRSSRVSQFSIMSSEDGGVGLDDVSSIAERLEEAIDPHHPPDYRLQLDSLKLGTFPFLNSGSQLSRAINLSRLSSLKLQACRQIDHLLDSWRQSSIINLKKLHLLIFSTPESGESSPAEIAISVNRFLGAFSGLQSLVVISRVHSRYPMAELERHSQTLQCLILDLKTSARSHLCFKLNRISMLYRSYPCLTELAIAVIFSPSIFVQLGLLAKQLTALHILNVGPNNDARSRLMDATMVAGRAITAAAAPLRLVCMATLPTTSGVIPMAISEDWQTMDVFYVQRVVNILGTGVPVLTNIGVKKAQELQGGRVKVLDFAWRKWT